MPHVCCEKFVYHLSCTKLNGFNFTHHLFGEKQHSVKKYFRSQLFVCLESLLLFFEKYFLQKPVNAVKMESRLSSEELKDNDCYLPSKCNNGSTNIKVTCKVGYPKFEEVVIKKEKGKQVENGNLEINFVNIGVCRRT